LPGSNNWLQSDTIPRRHKKSVPKSGAAIAYTNNKLYLLKGNNLNEFWQYVPEQISNIKNQISKTNTSIQTEEVLNQVPNDILFTVTPNPFIKSSVIRYTLPVSSNVSIKLYNSAGELIETLIDTYQGCGSYSLNIDNRRSEISKGIYFLRFETINNKQEVKIIKI
jgi:hypothetical protein